MTLLPHSAPPTFCCRALCNAASNTLRRGFRPGIKGPIRTHFRLTLTLSSRDGRRYDPFVLNFSFVTNDQKYVNMTDINISTAAKSLASQGVKSRDEPTWDIIELLFFAYRDFVGDPDEVLSKFGFGRAHHRVLHFVNRNPGMKVAELLDILRITKQSLGRVLKQLIDQGYVLQREGAQDRRQRLLFVTPKGEALALKLAMLQTERIKRAFAELGVSAHDSARRFLAAMIDAENRDSVIERVMRADRGGKGR